LEKETKRRKAMRLATTEQVFSRPGVLPPCNLRTALERGIRPAVGFQNPDDVVKDPHLTLQDKREILSSWASDDSAVQDEPRLRWLLGTVEPVPLEDVIEALKRLDAREAGDAGRPH
jgi:hypothetical protein